MTIKHLLLRSTAPALALAGAATLLFPAKDSLGFVKLGGSLNVDTARDFRILNNFPGAAANNNVAFDPDYPDWFGADQAIWKGAAEWGSGPHGTGGGDPTQAVIGSGGANFDFFFAGAATNPGSAHRTVSVNAGCGGGTLAYVTAGGNSTWNMTMCGNVNFDDGPGSVGGRIDIQSVAAHEFGHALGLDHSATFAATMWASIGGGQTSVRSIHSDDIGGVQCIYGIATANKPVITGVTVDTGAGTVTINGSNFSATGNEVWFASSFPTSPNTNPRVVLSGIDSPTGNQIVVSLPPTAGDGDLAVRNALSGHQAMSNAWPVNLDGAPGPVLEISTLTPGTIESLVPGTAQTVTLTGFGFSASTTVTVDGTPLPASDFTVVNLQSLTLDMPQVSSLGPITIQVDDGALSDSTTIQVVAPTSPTLQIGNGEPATMNTISSANGLDVVYAGPPGEFHYVLYSTSNVPSTIPVVSLCIGNNFSDLGAVTSGIIAAAGYNQLNLPLSPTFGVFFFQSLSFSQGTPIPASNCQEVLILF